MVAQFTTELPELHAFVLTLADDHAAGQIDGWPAFLQRVRAFYTPQMMDKIEDVAGGWKRMATFANHQTLIHVTSVLASLPLREEFQALDADQQNLMWWIVLFHDIAKEAHPERRDYVHALPGAVITAEALIKLDFGITLDADEAFYRWTDMTRTAVTQRTDTDQLVPDNKQLPAIIDGLTVLFGDDTPAALVIKAVLLQMSITVAPAWPQPSPFTDDEIKNYVTPRLYPLLKTMMIVDANGWAFFEPEREARETASIRKAFEHVTGLIGVS